MGDLIETGFKDVQADSMKGVRVVFIGDAADNARVQTIVKPTGVPATGLSGTIINPAAAVGIVAQNALEFGEMAAGIEAGTFPPERLDPANIDYASLAPEHIADAVVHAINQPWGVSIGDITIRAAGDHFIL